jgi:hypothetical protein
MTWKELLRFTYGMVMGTSTPYLKPSQRFLFPTGVVELDATTWLLMGGSGICAVVSGNHETLLINVNRGRAATELHEFLRTKPGVAESKRLIVLNSLRDDFALGLALFLADPQIQTRILAAGPKCKLPAATLEVLDSSLHQFEDIDQERTIEWAGEQIVLLPVKTAVSQDGLAVYLKNRSILFLGPLFYNGIHPILVSQGLDARAVSESIESWIGQVEFLLEKFNPKSVVPGEGDLTSREGVQNFFAYLRALSDPAVEFSYCRQNFNWAEIPRYTSLEENFELLRSHRRTHTSL